MFPPDLLVRAAELLARYRSAHRMIATAESCTGGFIAGLLTEIPGSSAVVERGFVVYSNTAKEELLGVPASTLERSGAVSEETARAMAEGALRASRADVAVSVTGVAGPDGGTAAKPVGLVHFACARRGARDGRARRAVRRHRPRRRAPCRGQGRARSSGRGARIARSPDGCRGRAGSRLFMQVIRR